MKDSTEETRPDEESSIDAPFILQEQDELDRLTTTWQEWVNNAPSPGRKTSRMRAHLFFLLIRFGGLLPGDIARLELPKALNLQTGTLDVNGKRIYLPAPAMRSLRPIFALPQLYESDFLHIDSGFLRKTFASVAQLAELPPGACAPRTLRYARACEMLKMSMPPHLVAKALGISNPILLTGLHRGEMPRLNHFPALITGIIPGTSSARLSFLLPGRLPLVGIFSLEELLTIEPAEDQMADLYLPPGCIFPVNVNQLVSNKFTGIIKSIIWDEFEIYITLGLGLRNDLQIHWEKASFEDIKLKTGKKISVHIPANLIQFGEFHK